jgi:hypothetical protein
MQDNKERTSYSLTERLQSTQNSLKIHPIPQPQGRHLVQCISRAKTRSAMSGSLSNDWLSLTSLPPHIWEIREANLNHEFILNLEPSFIHVKAYPIISKVVPPSQRIHPVAWPNQSVLHDSANSWLQNCTAQQWSPVITFFKVRG